MKYCLDTSALMDAWSRWYPPEVFETLWEKADALIEEGRFVSSSEVLEDLSRKIGDTLHVWATEREHLFLPLTDDVQECGTEIMTNHPRLVDGRTGKSFADPWVIATARVHECVVVTGEIATGSLDRPKIPDICAVMKISCMNFMQLIREEGWRF